MLNKLLEDLNSPSAETRRIAKESLGMYLKNIQIISVSFSGVIGWDDSGKEKILKVDKAKLAVTTVVDIYHQVDAWAIVNFQIKKFKTHPKIEND